MKEKDYIAASNLVKVRMAQQICGGIFTDKDITAEEQAAVMETLYQWEAKLVKKVGL